MSGDDDDKKPKKTRSAKALIAGEHYTFHRKTEDKKTTIVFYQFGEDGKNEWGREDSNYHTPTSLVRQYTKEAYDEIEQICGKKIRFFNLDQLTDADRA